MVLGVGDRDGCGDLVLVHPAELLDGSVERGGDEVGLVNHLDSTDGRLERLDAEERGALVAEVYGAGGGTNDEVAVPDEATRREGPLHLLLALEKLAPRDLEELDHDLDAAVHDVLLDVTVRGLALTPHQELVHSSDVQDLGLAGLDGEPEHVLLVERLLRREGDVVLALAKERGVPDPERVVLVAAHGEHVLAHG